MRLPLSSEPLIRSVGTVVGKTVGTLHGDRYIGGGGSFGPALTFGRISGREAARHALETAGLIE